MPKQSLESCIQTTKEISDDFAYKVSRSKSPMNKRAAQRSFDFWKSIHEHLTDYQKLLTK